MALIPKLAEERTRWACASRAVSPPMGHQGDSTGGAHSQRLDGEQTCKDLVFFLFTLFQNSQQAGVREPSSLGLAGSPRSRCLSQTALQLSLRNAKRGANKWQGKVCRESRKASPN